VTLAHPAKSQPRFFYGWVIVGVMAAVGGLSMALGTLNFGLFIKPMGDELGIGRATFGWAQSSRQIASALTALKVGSLLDLYGARVLLTISAAITGLAVAALAFVEAGWQIIVLFALMGVVGMSGPGALVSTVPVTRWFVRKRGKALATMSLGNAFGGLIFIPVTQIFINDLGWRLAWIYLAIIGASLIVPLSLIFVRREPEDMGLLPDGDPPRPPVQSSPGQSSQAPENGQRAVPITRIEEPAWTRAQALRSGTFWRLVAVFSVVQMATNSVGVHRIPSFMDRGFDPILISYATALDAGAVAVTTVGLGLMISRVPARYLGASGFALLALSSAMTILAADHVVMFTSMITFGLGIGGTQLMQNYLWAEYFGRRHLGSIRGAVMPIMLLLGGTGPPLAGYVLDYSGSYTPAWATSAALMTIGAVVLAMTPPPGHPTPLAGDIRHEHTRAREAVD
jgi:MFS family permease